MARQRGGKWHAVGYRGTLGEQGKTVRVHHVGIAVESLEETIPVFALLLGRQPDSIEKVENQKVRVAIFKVGEVRIELIESSSPESPVAGFIAKRGLGIHHLTFSVENLRQTLEDLKSHGLRLIDRAPRQGAGGESIAFVHPSSTSGVLIELLEESKRK